MPPKPGIEIDFDLELFVLFRDNDTVDQHSDVSITDSTLLYYLINKIDTFFYFCFALTDSLAVVGDS